MSKGGLWSRRDRTQLIKDILFILADGSVSKTRLQTDAGLNKKLFNTYVENILVRYGLVEKRKVDRVTYYTLTPKGRAYLNALIISDVEVLTTEEEFIEKVAEILTRHNIAFRRGEVAGDNELRLPVDFTFITSRGPLYAYLASMRAAAVAKHCAAVALRKLTRRTVVLVAPKSPGDSIDGNGVVPVIYYKLGSAEDAAARIMQLLGRLEHGASIEASIQAGSRRVIRI